jgi:hypothetical protein
MRTFTNEATRFFESIVRAARSNRITRRIYVRSQSFARIFASNMMALRTSASHIEIERLRERRLLEFRGNNNLELPLLWFGNLEATSAREAVEVASVISPKERGLFAARVIFPYRHLV